MKDIIKYPLAVIWVAFFVFSCEKTMPSLPAEQDVLDGAIEGLSTADQSRFFIGDEAFSEIFTIEKGLGPIFTANQCSSCHPGDGKGSPFVKLIRFGQADTLGNKALDIGGPQLQQSAIPGYSPEELPTGVASTELVAPAVTGLGFLDAVSDADIISLSDPQDADGDGISGRPHWNTVPRYVEIRPNSLEQNEKYITRFGKKATAYDLLHQSSVAYNQDMGIISLFEPIDPYSDQHGDPEVTNQTIHDLVFYLKTLKAPLRRDQDDADVLSGEQLFFNLGCESCHISTMHTAQSSISVLSNVEFHPYTDLLLHDMGPELDDGYTEGFALTSEWRTPPLWGLGLSKDAQGGLYFLMHDGRAHSIDEAITLHGGEAEQSKIDYKNLTADEKAKLIKFLESL